MIQIGIPDFHFENCPSRSSFFLQIETPFFWLIVIMNFFVQYLFFILFFQFVVSEFVFANCKYIIHFLAPSYLILLVIPGRRGGESWCQKGNRPIFWPFQTISGRKYFPPLWHDDRGDGVDGCEGGERGVGGDEGEGGLQNRRRRRRRMWRRSNQEKY